MAKYFSQQELYLKKTIKCHREIKTVIALNMLERSTNLIRVILCSLTFSYWALSQNCEKRLLALSCLSFRTEQLGSHLTVYMKFDL
jgi:hypothetical protein